MFDSLMRLIGYERRATAVSIGPPRDPAIAELFGGRETTTGVKVNEHTAYQFAAVFRAVHLIAGSVSSLPLHVYESTDTGERKRAKEHGLDFILNEEPNPEMDAATFRETLQGHILTWGNGYAEIERGGGNQVLYLWPLCPDRMEVRRDPSGEISYLYKPARGGERTLKADSVFHIPGFGFDGLVGYSPIKLAQQSIGLGLAAEEFGARFFGKGTHLGGLITRPANTPWKDEAAKRFRDDFSRFHEGLGKSHKIAVLEDGMTWIKLGIPPEEAQFLETRKFQISEIARWYGIPPHLLFDLERATFSNIEEQGAEFVTYSLRYWLKKWERAIKRQLMTADDKRKYYAEHLTDDLVKANITARYEAYDTGRNGGWLSINDIRRRENMGPVDGGDTYLQPLNMQASNQTDKPAAKPGDKRKDE